MWFANVAELSRSHRLYAVDTIGTAGKSMAIQSLDSRADLGNWLIDVLDGLGIARARILGHSHGGWLALNFALSAPERVRQMILLAPAGALRPLVKQFYIRGIPTMLFPHRSLIIGLMNWMTVDGFVVSKLFVEQFVLGMKHFRPQIRVWPSVFADHELQQIETPTLLLIGAQEVIYDPRAAVDRARQLIQDIEAEIIPNVSHGLPMERPKVVNQRILSFFNQAADC
jgi:pimeloyl-ACP methyl ester carboxylesterase